jgi:hypothetical protein
MDSMRAIPLVALCTGLVLDPSRYSVALTRIFKVQADDRVEFRIREAPSSDSTRVFEAEYSEAGTVARFAFTFRALPPTSSDISFIKLALLSRPGSDASALLGALARLHSGSLSKKKPPRLLRLDISAGVLGQSLSHGPGKDVIAGEFSTNPRGDWLVLKLFLDTPDGATTDKIGEPAEIFVALNPSAGRGWFLPKDPEYWPELNRVLAMVL